MLVIAKRIVLQNFYDKRTLALMMVVPLIILSLVYALFNSTTDIKPYIGVYKTETNFTKLLKENDFKVITYEDNKDIDQKIATDNLAAFISQDSQTLNVTYENFDLSATAKIKTTLNFILLKQQAQQAQKQLKLIESQVNPQKAVATKKIANHYVYLDENITYFDTISPVLITLFVFFFVFLVAGISLLNERTTGTLQRLLATPLKRSQLIFGYFLGYGIFATIQTFIVVLYAVYVLNTPLIGNLGLVLLTNILIAFVALSLGILLSSFAKSEFQMMQFIPLVIIPQVFFAGIIQVSTMADPLQKLAHILPLYYAGNTLQDIMIKGQGFNDISLSILALLAFIVIFTALNIVALKRYRAT